MKKGIILVFFCLGLFLVSSVSAKVTGPCSNCHTMHNSQGGDHMMFNEAMDGTAGGTHGGGYGSLTRGSCVGCHTGTNTGGDRPFVYSTSPPNYGSDTLAGGNFYWATQNDERGHNVKGIPAMTSDSNLTEAPGNQQGGCATSCHTSLYDGIAEATGCEGCHLEPKHHATQQTAGAPALEANGYFRFLSGHISGAGNGVEGIEDDDWQFTANATDHNEYLGSDGNEVNANTMSNYCIGCHGDFHVQEDNSEWVRHPSDAVIPATGEYAAYVSYDPNVPVARLSLTGITTPGIVNSGEDMVFCLSCHRAHGSPYPDMLRWEYDGMVAGNGGIHSGTGCFTCHSEKD